jgi:chromosome segregation ATPase
MTSLGKLLVLANTFASVILFGWAVSLYVNRPEWFDRTVGEDKIAGQIPQLQAEVKRLSEIGKSVQTGYAAANDRLLKAEHERDFRAYVLNKRLADIRRVDDQVTFTDQKREDRSALIDVRGTGVVINGLNGKKLKGLGALRKEYDDLIRKSTGSTTAILKARGDFSALCKQIDDVQAEVIRQKIIQENLTDEQDYLFDARIVWEEQLRTLELRRSQLQSRLTALGGK